MRKTGLTIADTTYTNLKPVLSHVLVLETLELIIAEIHFAIQYNVVTKLAVTLTVFLTSMVLTQIIIYILIIRELLLGESI